MALDASRVAEPTSLLRGVPAISPPRKLRWVLDAGCWVGALDPAPRSALRSCQPGAARCRWRLDSSLIQHPATQPSSLSTQRIQPLGAWVEAGSSRRAPGWVMYMGTGSSLGEAGWQGAGFGRNASNRSSQVESSSQVDVAIKSKSHCAHSAYPHPPRSTWRMPVQRHAVSATSAVCTAAVAADEGGA